MTSRPASRSSCRKSFRDTANRPERRFPSSGRRRRRTCCRLCESKNDKTMGPFVTRANSRRMVILSAGVAMCCSRRMHRAPENVPSPKGSLWTLAQARGRASPAATTMFGSRSTSTVGPGSSSDRRPAPHGASSQVPLLMAVMLSRLAIAFRSRLSVPDPEPVRNRLSR